MDMNLDYILGIFLVALVANSQDFLGASFIGRPIVTGPIIGLIFGDLTQGIIIGGQLELIFIGLVGIGATVPPDEIMGGIIATALTIQSGYDIEVALTIVLPVATLGLVIKNFLYVIVFPAMTHKADSLAAEGKITESANMHLKASFTRIILMSVATVLVFIIGSNTIESILNIIPQAFIDGMSIAGNILPAIGFAMLLNMIFKKDTAPFFLIGFLAVAYLNLDLVAVSIIGVALAGIMYVILEKISNQKNVMSNEGEEFDDF